MSTYSALWSRPGLTIAGTGGALRVDPGTGPHRYQRALRALEESGRTVAFASFTFDPAQTGSVVVIPEETGSQFVFAPVIPGGRLDEYEDPGWRAMVDCVLDAIELGLVSKVVLARHLNARLNAEPDPYAIAASLLEQQYGCHIFVVDGLVGASPELLLSLDTGILRSTPLAGSSMHSDAELSTAKMTEEHLIAADSVADALILSGVTFEREPSEVLDVGTIKHLATSFTGKVEAGTSFADLLPQMHPTAAVAGTPRPSAMDLIRRLEGNTRGRYSGPVGWFDTEGNCEFALALRCGLVQGRRVTLHSGAGIVAGSEPGAELEETRWKLQPMIDALGLDVGSSLTG